MEISPVNVRDASEIERAVAAFARPLNNGLIATGSASTSGYDETIIKLAARHKLPAVYPNRFSILAGGLICYGPDRIDQYRRAAGYIDRILKGEKPAHMPVQAPIKYETVINLKTAKALGQLLLFSHSSHVHRLKNLRWGIKRGYRRGVEKPESQRRGSRRRLRRRLPR